jgi:hypothetical protein
LQAQSWSIVQKSVHVGSVVANCSRWTGPSPPVNEQAGPSWSVLLCSPHRQAQNQTSCRTSLRQKSRRVEFIHKGCAFALQCTRHPRLVPTTLDEQPITTHPHTHSLTRTCSPHRPFSPLSLSKRLRADVSVASAASTCGQSQHHISRQQRMTIAREGAAT